MTVAGGRPLLGTSSIRPAGSRPRRPDEAIALPISSWEPIDARAGRIQEDRSLVHLVEILSKLGSQPENLLLHDAHTRPVRAPPLVLADDMDVMHP